MLNRTLLRYCTVSVLTLGSALNADELRMKNGSVLIGELVSAESDLVVFDTPFAGTITITQDNIERITTDEPVTLLMNDGTVHKEKQIISTEVAMLVKTEGERSALFAADDIEMVNPEPWKLGEGYEWTGAVSVAVEYERGNADTDDWDIKANTSWRSLKDRYTWRGAFEYEESRGTKKTDNWNTLFKYDRFFQKGGRDYRGVKAMAEHDEFADLNLRTMIGPHVGREFWNSERLTLEAEFGPVWVNENFDSAEDDEWLGLLWYMQAKTNILGCGTTTYVSHDGTLNTENTRNTLMNATIGISFPLVGGFETAVEVELEYDGGAVKDVEQLDETYNLRFGYSW